jgi:predicted metalloprotease
MRWQGRRQSGNIEDRRGTGGGGFGGGFGRIPIGFPTGGRMGGGTGGGLGIVGLLIVLGIMWFAGINPIDMLTGSGGAGPFVTDERTGQSGTPADEQGQFVAAVLANTEDAWKEIFSAAGRNYQEPTLVLFAGATSSACGYASSASGPFYCPQDRKVYIDLAFFDQLRNQFRSPGDFAQAYVISHEIGHHVQNQLGVLKPGNLGSGATSQAVRTELQADCFAGIWARYAEVQGVLEIGDIDEALNAASQIGDDTLLRRAGGRAVPDSFTHGTSEQRSRWFKRGYQMGTLAACDTFSATSL